MKRKDLKYRGEKCINCETSLDISEKYCHACGQLNSTKKLDIKDFIEEFFSNFYAYDSRLRNTFITLFTKPGVAAREFSEGKRHHHANPFRLFLSISIVLFIVMDIGTRFNNNRPKEKTETELISKDSTKIDYSKIYDTGVIEVDKKTGKEFHRDSIYKATEFNNPENLDHLTLRITSFRNYNLKNPQETPAVALKKLGYENNKINRYIYEKVQNLKSNDVLREISDYILGKLPFLIFLSIPFIAIIFWITFYNKTLYYTDHLVFTYNFYSFMFVSLILLEIIGFISTDISEILIGVSFSILFPIYLYKSLRNFYQNSRWKTIFKFLFLNILFIPISLLAVFVLIAVSIILF